MDPLAQEDIVAAAAAHRDLGRDYDNAVAEGLVERIGAEIDKRIDARLDDQGIRYRRGRFRASGRPGPSGGPGRASGSAHRPAWEVVPLVLGSLLIAAITTNSMVNSGHASGAVVALIWLIVGAVNVGFVLRRR